VGESVEKTLKVFVEKRVVANFVIKFRQLVFAGQFTTNQ